MMQMVTKCAMQIGPIAQAVHLMDANAGQLLGFGLEGIDQSDRLAVGERHDDISAVANVIKHGFRATQRHAFDHRLNR